METYINKLNAENKKTYDLIIQEHTELSQEHNNLLQEKKSLHNELLIAKNENDILRKIMESQAAASRAEVESARAFRDKLYDDDVIKHLMKKNNKWYIVDDLEKKNYKTVIKELYDYLEDK
jgi:hypothetical protein